MTDSAENDALRDALARAIRDAVRIGPFGPNSLEILNRGGRVHLTGTEADAAAEAVLTVLATRVLPPGWNPTPPEGGYTVEDFR